MNSKVRYVDYNPDAYISGVAAKLSAEQQGVYWMVCSQIMATGGGIDNNPKEIGRMVCLGAAKTKRIINELVSKEKLVVKGSKLTQNRAENELEKAQKRIKTSTENGKKGGRPSNKNKDLDKPAGSSENNLITNNHNQSPITNKEREKEISLKDYTNEFLEWWQEHPSPSQKPDAFRLYRDIIESGEIKHSDLLDKTKQYAEHCKNTGTYPKGAYLWLKDRRYEDEFEISSSTKVESGRRPPTPEEVEAYKSAGRLVPATVDENAPWPMVMIQVKANGKWRDKRVPWPEAQRQNDGTEAFAASGMPHKREDRHEVG